MVLGRIKTPMTTQGLDKEKHLSGQKNKAILHGRRIRKIYSEIPDSYERVNHVLTFCLDIRWRNRAARSAVTAGGARWLDVCSGTGEMAALLRASAGNGTAIVAVDLSLPMLSRARGKPGGDSVLPCIGDARALPFPDDAFDLVMISFATRNLNIDRGALLECFREFRRVLKPGARFVNLETSQPPSRVLRKLFHMFVRLTVRRVGSMLSGAPAAYSYLSHTIPRFFSAEELSCILHEAGFTTVGFSRMSLGIAAIHTAVR